MLGLLSQYTDFATRWTTTEFDLSPILCILTSSGPHPASYPNVIPAADVKLTAHFHEESGLRMCGAIPLLPYVPVRHAAQLTTRLLPFLFLITVLYLWFTICRLIPNADSKPCLLFPFTVGTSKISTTFPTHFRIPISITITFL